MGKVLTGLKNFQIKDINSSMMFHNNSGVLGLKISVPVTTQFMKNHVLNSLFQWHMIKINNKYWLGVLSFFDLKNLSVPCLVPPKTVLNMFLTSCFKWCQIEYWHPAYFSQCLLYIISRKFFISTEENKNKKSINLNKK